MSLQHGKWPTPDRLSLRQRIRNDQTKQLSERIGLPAFRANLQRMRWYIRSLLGAHPAYLTVLKYRHPEKTVCPNTTLVIEGFPRSGNTFAEMAFRMAQPYPVRLAHHLHVPAQIIGGLRLGLPVLLLIRPPDDAILSFVIKTGGHLSLQAALRYYVRFYEALLDYREELITVTFDELVSDFGRSIGRLNDQFGTCFSPFTHTQSDVNACFDRIDQRFQYTSGGVDPGSVGRPLAQRQLVKADLRRVLQGTSSLQNVRNRAKGLYAAFAANSNIDGTRSTHPKLLS